MIYKQAMKSLLLVLAGVVFAAVTGHLVRSFAQAPAGYTQCYAATVWSITGRELNQGGQPRDLLRVPKGWTVVGGTVVGSSHATLDPAVLLCR